MAAVDDGQAAGITNAKADAADDNLTGSVAVPLQPAADSGVLTVVSGTALQVNATRDAFVTVNIKTAAALQIDMGPTSAVAFPVSISQSSALGVIGFFVPKGWYVKFTGTVSNYAINRVLLNT